MLQQTEARPSPRAWHALPIVDVLRLLGTNGERGLTSAEAARRLAEHGPNALTPKRHEPWWEELLEELREPMILLLLGVALGYFVLGERRDAVVVFAITAAILGIEMVSEARAKRAIAALRVLSSPLARLVRDGTAIETTPERVVPGDLVLLQPGERVPADVRLIESTGLRIDEAALTGESVPVTKRAGETLDERIELGDRVDLAYAGTLVVGGKGRGAVVATGQATEMGRIGRLVAAARDPRTPLQLAMGRLAASLAWVAIAVSVAVPLAALALGGTPLPDAVLAGLTLAFATIPEELPILITVVLALGALQLSRRHAYVKRLVAAETLGAVTAICTDKTGTLTRNEMTVRAAWLSGAPTPALDALAGDPLGERLLLAAVRANDAETVARDGVLSFTGDPTETALLAAARAAGLDVVRLGRTLDVVNEWPFDETRRRMSVLYRADGGLALAMKGAVESVLSVASRLATRDGDVELTEADRERVRAETDRLAADGLRVLAFADAGGARDVAREEGAVLLGLLALQDPARPGARAAITEVRSAGVRVLMLTGDHPATASAIARAVGLDDARAVVGREIEDASDAQLAELLRTSNVFARITPEHKLRIVRALEAGGEVVAVTGDGVNDAPALKQAAIGVAMGRTGSDVAKEVADLVLGDDNFATVALAVREGRRLYANLRKAVAFYLSAKVALVLASIVAVATHAPLPFAPIQLILLELFMDVFASIVFTAEPGEPDAMRRPPRGARARFLDARMLTGIAVGSVLLGGAVAASYLAGWLASADQQLAQTMAFETWMVGHVVLALAMRGERGLSLASAVVSNRPYLVWVAAAAIVILGVQLLPAATTVLHARVLDASALGLSLALGLLPLAALALRVTPRRAGDS